MYGNPDDHDEDDTPLATKPVTANGMQGGQDFLKQSARPTVADSASADMNGAAARALAYAKVRNNP